MNLEDFEIEFITNLILDICRGSNIGKREGTFELRMMDFVLSIYATQYRFIHCTPKPEFSLAVEMLELKPISGVTLYCTVTLLSFFVARSLS